MLSRLVIQQVEEVFDSKRDGTTGAEDHREQVVHKLLQRPLEHREVKTTCALELGTEHKTVYFDTFYCHTIVVHIT